MSKSLEPLPLEEHPALKSVAAFRYYYAEFFSSVWAETLRFFGWNWRTLLVPLLYIAGAIVAFFTLEGEVVRDEILTALAFGLIPVGGLAVLVTLVNIIRAPYLLDAKRQGTIESVDRALNEKLLEKNKTLALVNRDLKERQKEVGFYREQSQTNYGEIERLREKTASLQDDVARLELSKHDLEARFLPELSIIYKADAEHFVQEYEGVKQYRVAAVSTVAMNDAEMVANQLVLTDGIMNVRHSRVHMRPMHDRNAQGTRRVIMKPFEYEYWDVVSEDSGKVWVNHIEAVAQTQLSPGVHEFELRITGGQKPAASSIVSVTVSEDQRVTMFKVTEGRISVRDPRGLVFLD